MNEYARAWVEALESGQHKQAIGYPALQDPNTGEVECCALGLANELFYREVGISRYTTGRYILVLGDPRTERKLISYGQASALHPRVQKLIGLRTELGSVGRFDRQRYNVMMLNDIARATFPEIAAFIRANAEELFFND